MKEVWARGKLGGDPLKRKRPHICSDSEEDISTKTSTPIKTKLLVWPPLQ